jgi:amino acid transporter
MARLPFVAGVDRVLPAPFARLHPRWGTPYIALIGQGLLTAGFILLGQAGTSVRAAYDLLVSLGVLTYFLPYLFMFAALLRLGTSWATACWAGLGFVTTAGCMGLAAVPSPAEADPFLATVKLVGLSVLVIGVGTGLYFWGKQRSATKDLP